ncbi:hypothetical protein IP65_20295 [Novosphingobium sp. AAP1]|nr:hypothetical protein IP65_20295 [Novosphingobium sp. AAP1]
MPGLLRRLRVWMHARRWRLWLILGFCWLFALIAVMAAWIGVAFLRQSTDRDAGAIALNLVLVWLLATVGLTVVHRGMYRRFRDNAGQQSQVARDQNAPLPSVFDPSPRPTPRIVWPWSLRVRHFLIYLVGIVTILYVFAPYSNQIAIVRFLLANSAGRASAGSLSALVFGFVPMVTLTVLIGLLTRRQMKRRDAGLLDADGKALLDAETSWLFSFVAAFIAIMFLCRWAGGMIVQTL